MKWFRRKTKVGAEAFVAHQIENAFGEGADNIRQMLRSAQFEPDEQELLIFSAFNNLSGMTLAGLSQGVRYRFVEEAFNSFERAFPGKGKHLQKRLAEYSEAFGTDVEQGKEHLAPNLLSRALDAIVGNSDESAVSARMALVFIQKSCLETKVPFYKDLKVI